MTSLSTEQSDERVRIDRRQAMKAALGGAAAAAALAGPRIEGFSIAPDFASASSQCAGGTVVAGAPTLTKNSISAGLFRCWGSGTALGCNNNVAVTGTTTIPVASPNFVAPTVTITVGGQVKNDNGRIDITLANFTLNEPYASCTVKVTGTCTSGQTFSTLVPSTVRTTNGSFGGRIRCSGGAFDSPSGTVNVTTSCICGPD